MAQNLQTNESESNVDLKQKKDSYYFRYWNSLCSSFGNIVESLQTKTIRRPIKFLAILIIIFIFILISIFGSVLGIINFIGDQITFILVNNKDVFYDHEGNIEWVGISAIIAIITLFINSLYDKRKFKADLVSKSRIAWIQLVRNYTSEYLSSSVGFKDLLETLQNNHTLTNDTDKEDYKIIESMNELQSVITRNRELILLNLSINKGNSNFINNVEELFKEIHIIIDESFLDYEKIASNYDAKILNCKIEKLRNTARDYFKEEWEKAKLGK